MYSKKTFHYILSNINIFNDILALSSGKTLNEILDYDHFFLQGNLYVLRHATNLIKTISNKEYWILASKFGYLHIIKYYFHENLHGYTNNVFITAAEYGHLNIIKFLIIYNNRNIYVHKLYTYDTIITSLELASKHGYKKIIDYLYKHFSCSYLNSNNSKALYYAAENGYYHIVKNLIKYNHLISNQIISIVAYNGHFRILCYLMKNYILNESIIHYIINYIAKNGHLSIIKYLYQKLIKQYNIDKIKLNTNTIDDVCYTSLNNDLTFRIVKFFFRNSSYNYFCTSLSFYNACKKGNYLLLRFLFFHINRKNYGSNLLDIAAENGHKEIVYFLHNYNIDSCTSKAMDLASKNGHREIVQFLHEIKKECTSYAIDFAAENGYLEIVKFLHENRDEGCTNLAIDLAAENGYLNIVQFLYEHRGSFYTKHAIEGATKNGHIEIVKYLYEICNLRSIHIINFAAQFGHLNIVTYIHMKENNIKNYRAMDLAAEHGHIEIVKFLHNNNYNCSKNAINNAASNGHTDIINFLLENRNEGFTEDAFYSAIEENYIQIVKVLYQYMLKHNNCNYSKSYSIELAVMNKHIEILHYLCNNHFTIGQFIIFHVIINEYIDILKLFVKYFNQKEFIFAMTVAKKHDIVEAIEILQEQKIPT